MGVNGLGATIVECPRCRREGKVYPVYCDGQVGVRVVNGAIYAMAQIVGQRHKTRGPREQDHGDYNYGDENYYDCKGRKCSLSPFSLDIPENLLFPGLGQ